MRVPWHMDKIRHAMLMLGTHLGEGEDGLPEPRQARLQALDMACIQACGKHPSVTISPA